MLILATALFSERSPYQPETFFLFITCRQTNDELLAGRDTKLAEDVRHVLLFSGEEMYTFKLTLMTLLWSSIVVLALLAPIPATPAASVALSTRLPASISASTTIPYTSYLMNPGMKSPLGMVRGPNNNVWFFENFDSGNSAVAQITPNGAVTDFPIPNGPSPFSDHIYLTVGPDSDLWYPQLGNGAIGRVTSTGVTTTLPISGTSPIAIAAGPDGNLWVSEASGYQIERM